MSEASSTVTGAAGRYATALFELARDTSALDAASKEVAAVKAALADSAELSGALSNPSISRDAMKAAMAALGEKMGLSDLMRKFLGLMAANRRLAELPAALSAFETLAAAERGEATATVTAAAPLTDAQAADLQKALAASAGKTVHMTVDVDPDLIGGLVVQMGSKMIDASTRSKLARLSQAMKEGGR